MSFVVKGNALSVPIYMELRKKVNFKEYKPTDVAHAIEHSLYSVVVFDGMKPIGIARLVGDDRICFFLKDVVVDPDYQKMLIGNLLMEYIDKYIASKACDGAYIGLMSTPNCIRFYEKHGFEQRPNINMGPGMIKFYNRYEEVIE
ncbi:MAG: GNAT family N-acetyltransferase [Longicatena sp.]